jgi:transcriptional regulator with XRE-family HTH domain
MSGIPAAFRERRIALGLTQARVAELARISRKTVSDFERDVGAITIDNLSRLLLAVGLELSTREASSRPVFDELKSLYPDEADEPPPARRARAKNLP